MNEALLSIEPMQFLFCETFEIILEKDKKVGLTTDMCLTAEVCPTKLTIILKVDLETLNQWILSINNHGLCENVPLGNVGNDCSTKGSINAT